MTHHDPDLADDLAHEAPIGVWQIDHSRLDPVEDAALIKLVMYRRMKDARARLNRHTVTVRRGPVGVMGFFKEER